MMNQYMKKSILMMAILSLTLIFAACSSDSDSNSTSSNGSGSNEEKVEIRFSWWGDTGRNEVYNEIVDRFEEEHPNITVKREFGGWGDYWDRLATQIAGGNAPDVVSMHQFYVSDYARRDALLNLNEYVSSDKINLTDFPESAVDSGKIDDNIFMVAKGITMPAMAYNTAIFDELGVDYPDFDWTWDEFTATLKELKAAFGDGKNWGIHDISGGQLQPTFRYFVRQNGQDIFTEDGQLGFDKETLTKWWTMWDDLRQENIIPDAATGNEYDGVPLEANMFTTGVTAITQIPANQVDLYQNQMTDTEIRLARMPSIDGGPNGEYIEGAYLSITENSSHPEEAAMFIDFFVNSEKSAELFKVQQGPPAGEEMSTYILDLIDPAQARAVEFIQQTAPLSEPAPYAPTGINEVEQVFSDNSEAIGFGAKTVEQAVEDFMKEAEAILNR